MPFFLLLVILLVGHIALQRCIEETSLSFENDELIVCTNCLPSNAAMQIISLDSKASF